MSNDVNELLLRVPLRKNKRYFSRRATCPILGSGPTQAGVVEEDNLGSPLHADDTPKHEYQWLH